MNEYTVIFLVALLYSSTIVSVTSFAAKKSGGKKKRVASSGAKGFGAPPPTWQEVAQKCKTRMPRDTNGVNCPCGSGLQYSECCAPYHEGTQVPESPLKVLQSRYTAFAWRKIQYIIDTTHPNCEDWREDKVAWVKDLNKMGMFDNHDFVGLEAGAEETVSDSEGYITFKVNMRGHDGSDFEGQERVVSERSQFLKGEDGRWLYATGEVAVK